MTRILYSTLIMLSLAFTACGDKSQDKNDANLTPSENIVTAEKFFYISTSTDRSEEGTDGVFEAFHGFAICLYGSVERGVIRGNGARNRGDIDSHPAMQEAYEMGKGV